MNWLFVLFDTVFSALYSENWFDVISGKLTSRTENIVYQIEAGTFDFHSISRLLEHIVYLIPIVFALCLVVDFFIRSRFVRYSYKDEYQAKKSVWWNWQSQEDAYQALEAGNGQMALADHSVVDPNFRIVGAETWTPQPPVTQQPAPASQNEIPEEEQEEDDIDRGMIEDARQNEIRKKAAVSERVQNRFTDMRDGFTVFGSWLAFFPKALQRRVAMNRKNRELRKMYAAMNKKTQKRAVFEERDEEAAAEAYFAQDMMQNVVDGEFEQIETVETGGLDAYTFTHAAQTVQNALAQPEEAQEEEEQEPPEEEETEPAEDDVPDEEGDGDSDEAEENESEEEEDMPEEPESTEEETGEEEPVAEEESDADAEEEAEAEQEETGEELQEEPEKEEPEDEAAREEPREEAEPEETAVQDPEESAPKTETGFEAAAVIVRETFAE